uniref:Choline transporter-like protein n=1 Tax=Crassostrea virginica TaxID=6565 RepID=A0A8B8CJG2_CRAVI|nr:choline transporter-like protein 1 [Crassostrea virginica]XP_022315977.1 choline transporter-like protein 1 [Crassostrea virginica]
MGCCGDRHRVVPYKGTGSSDSEFSGPLQKRACRDVVCLCVFVGLLGGVGYGGYLAVTWGDPDRLIYGVDSWGNVCSKRNRRIEGVSRSGEDCTDKRNLFFYDKSIFVNYVPGSHITTDRAAVCVRSCPSRALNNVADLQAFYNQTGSSLCWYDVPPGSFFDGAAHGRDRCPSLAIEPHESFLFRCIPESFNKPFEILTGAINDVLNKIDPNFTEKCVSDLKKTWREICYLSATALGVSLSIVILLRFIAGVVIWLMVLLLGLGSVVGTALCWYHYYELKGGPNSEEESNWLIGSISATVVMVIVVLVLLVMRRRIGLVVQLFKEAGRAVSRVPFLLLQPLWTILCFLGFFALLSYIFLAMESAGQPIISNTTGFVSFEKDDKIKGLKWFHIFASVWILQFIFACEKIVISGAVAIWYFQRDSGMPTFPILLSIKRLLRYHLGSAVFGSFIITLLVVVNWILGFIHKRVKNSSCAVGDFLMKCLRCCFWCFENAIRFINSNAYIEIAILGEGFCGSAQRALKIIVSNSLRLAAINSVGDFTLFLGKAGTVAVVAVVGMEMLATRSDVIYPWLPITLSCIIAFIIASCLIGVYELCIDTIFVCFCEDCERNDGVQKPYYMSTGLMKFISGAEGGKHVEVKHIQMNAQAA